MLLGNQTVYSYSDTLHCPWYNFTFPFYKTLTSSFPPNYSQLRTVLSNSLKKEDNLEKRTCIDSCHQHDLPPISIVPTVLPPTVHSLQLLLARVHSPISSISLKRHWISSSPHHPPYQFFILYSLFPSSYCCYFSYFKDLNPTFFPSN